MILVLTFLCGLIIGSFLNVCIYRLARGESIALPDLIPVPGWGLLRGKCRRCGEKIPWRYPVTEFVNALAWVYLIWQWGLTPRGLAGLLLFSFSLVITQIDLEHYIIPNRLVIILLISGLVYHFFARDLTLLNRGIGLATGFAVPFILALLSRGGIGGGDIKLMGAMGVWLGFPDVLYALFIGSLVGSLMGVGLIIFGKKKRKEPIPFGPFLVLGFLLMFFFSNNITY